MKMEFKLEVEKISCDKKPPKRTHFGLCKLNNNTIAIFGGYDGHLLRYYDDFWMLTGFKNNKYKWIEIKREGTDNWPSKVMGNTLNYYNRLKNIYLFGGRVDNLAAINSFWIFNIQSKIWKQLPWKIVGDVPQMWKHNSVMYKHYIIYFGGSSGNIHDYSTGYQYSKCYNTIYIFNCKDNTWITYDSEHPKPRFSHGMTMINSILIVYGGTDNHYNLEYCNYSDMYSINIDYILNNNNPQWNRINTNTYTIAAHILRSDNNRIYCTGGNKSIRSTEYLLQNDFTQKYSDTHSTIPVPSVIIYIITKFLGNNVDIFVGKFIQHNCNINKMQHLNGCTILIKKTHYLFIFGGQGSRYYNDSYLIKLDQ